jgi:hypothetical protein
VRLVPRHGWHSTSSSSQSVTIQTGQHVLTNDFFVRHGHHSPRTHDGAVLNFLTKEQSQATLTLEGTQKHIGRYTAFAEFDFAPAEEGVKRGSGAAVLTAANGDVLVGIATAEIDSNTGDVRFHFSWRDSVTLRDGRVVRNTGRFLKHRPPGLVVVGTVSENLIVKLIISILR